MLNNKGFSNILVISIAIVLLGIGGYFVNRSLASPLSWNPLKMVLKFGPSLVWNTIKTPLMYLGGLYVLYKTVKGFLRGHSERSDAKKIAQATIACTEV